MHHPHTILGPAFTGIPPAAGFSADAYISARVFGPRTLNKVYGNVAANSFSANSGPAPGVTFSQVYLWQTGNQPIVNFIDSSRTANNRVAAWAFTGGSFKAQFTNDAFGSSTDIINIAGGQGAGITSVTCSGPWTIAAGNFTATNGAAPSAATSAVKIWQTSNVPIVNWVDSSRAANARLVTGYYQSGTFSFGYTNDAFSVTLNFMDVVGTSAAITSITFPNGNVVITNNLTVNGNTTIGNASGDTLTVAPNAVTWSNNPTHSGNHVFSGNISVNGNTTIGDASGDTLTVAPNAVTWSNNPTHSGNHIFSGNVTINGNSTLGDAAADTVTVTGTPAGQVIGSTYTPTRSAEANLDSNVTLSQAQYLRVGATVTVSGTFTADPTLTATATSFEMTLPVASNIGAIEDVAGVAFCGAIAGQGAQITGSIANDKAVVSWIAGDITSQTWSYTFTYQII